jgi:hypothetical protein
MMATKDTDPFGFSEGAKVALEQTHQAMDTYFDFLKKSISAFPQAELRLVTGGRKKAY